MPKIEFHRNERPTVGIELELGLVDAKSMALTSAFGLLNARLTAEGHQSEEGGTFKPELMQCELEINTAVCKTIGDADRDLRGKLAIVESACDALGLRLWWGATHPFSTWLEQKITPDDRYLMLVNLLQEMARRLVTFGLHVHVGVDSGDKAVMICDRIMRHLPTLLALSVSSPFWEGRKTGLQSHRSKVMEGLPTAGLPTPDAQLERICVARKSHDRYGLHQHDSRDLVGRAPASQLWHGRSPRVRHAGQLARHARTPAP